MDLISQVNNPGNIEGKRVNVTISKIDLKKKGIKTPVSESEATALGITFKLKDQSAVWTNFNLKRSGQPTWPLERLLAVTKAKNTAELLNKDLSIVPMSHVYEGAPRLQATAFAEPIADEVVAPAEVAA
ncbi:MAG: hypothetical protein WC389_17095 [Lutibacter sp.]|jgi:hypothetical protein